MEPNRTSPVSRPTEMSVAQLAKAALRRLAVQRLEPTPENYARAWSYESGDASAAAPATSSAAGVPPKLADRLLARLFEGEPTAQLFEAQAALVAGRWDALERALEGSSPVASDALANVLERIVRSIDSTGRAWTPARRREGLQRVIASSRNDPRRLQHKLTQLVNSWASDLPAAAHTAAPGEPVRVPSSAAGASGPVTDFVALTDEPAPADGAATAATEAALKTVQTWQRAFQSYARAMQAALPRLDGGSGEVTAELAQLNQRFADEGATHELADALDDACKRAERSMQHRHHLFEQLGKLCHELTASLGDLAENESWVKGQCDAMRVKIEEGLSARGVRQVSDMLHHARKRHNEVRAEREEARDALKVLITQMLGEIGELGSRTGDFEQNMTRYAETIEKADSIEGLAGVVRELVSESRSVQQVVQQTQARLQHEHSKATGLSERVSQLENEMKRLSDEVSTDQLTQIANRRGLVQAFEIERARLERSGAPMAIGLLDIDNFKRLNDELGHSAGDEALKSLAAIVSSTLRPTDRVARYGGEEFVVLLPDTPVEEGEQILTRLQRSLTGGLFMHKERQIFVTFSAGVTRYRNSERIEDALERADVALYEAKRTGKNRTCIA